MPKINIKNYVTEMKLYPATSTHVIDGLLSNGIFHIRDLMSADEEKVSSIPYIKGKNLESLKKWMEEREIHFGMSEEEIEEYDISYWSGDR